MNLKYVPILRNLQSEREAIKHLNLSDGIIPLIELILEKPQVNSKKDFISFNKEYLSKLSSYFLVDIPMYINITKVDKIPIKNFLSSIYNNNNTRINHLLSLSSISPQKMIPIVSYNPNITYIKNTIAEQTNNLSKVFSKIGYRIFEPCPNEVIEELKKLVTQEDILLLDIRNKNHSDKYLKDIYSKINDIKSISNCKTVILHRPLPDTIKNTKLIDNHVVSEAVTTLLDSYNKEYKFDAFGDFAGIKVPSLNKIPVSSPAYIHYDNSSNKYFGFKGVFKEIRTFESMVLPKYSNSKYWASIYNNHKISCYGCKLIQDMLVGKVKINYAPRWKTLTICHYINSIDEILL